MTDEEFAQVEHEVSTIGWAVGTSPDREVMSIEFEADSEQLALVDIPVEVSSSWVSGLYLLFLTAWTALICLLGQTCRRLYSTATSLLSFGT